MSDGDGLSSDLSKREKEVAGAYAAGQSYKEIARDLGISPTTVRTHLRTVYGKLGVTSKIELARFLSDASVPEQDRDSAALVADLALELDEAIRRERGLAQILQIISKQDDQLEPVIEAVLDHALEICEAEFGVLFEFRGDMHARELQSRNVAPDFQTWLRDQGVFELNPDTAIGRMAVTRQTVNIADVRGEDVYKSGNPLRIATADLGKARSFAAIPMMSGGQLIGAFTVYRTRVHPFNDRSLELAQVFADQAVIAIENVRQFQELQVRLKRAQSNREILELIRTSRDNEQPVFEAIARNAVDLCKAQFCMLWRYDGTDIHYCASNGFSREFMETYLADYPMPPNPAGIVFQVLQAGKTVHLPNAQAEPYSDAAVARRHGYDYMLAVPVEIDGGMWGTIVLGWPEGLTPGAGQVEVLETFAAHAVIAIENARHFRELQARLDRQAATRKVLEVISQSRDDEMPVFDAILENSARLCNAPLSYLAMANDDRTEVTTPAHLGARPQFAQGLAQLRVPMTSQLALCRSITECKVIRMDDIADDDLYRQREPNRVNMVENEGARSILVAPLVSNGLGLGSITLYRREVAPFSDDDVALVETFAAQAVIAIENVRQFREVRKRLEREAATSQILQVINQSRSDYKPVFDVIMESAMELCEAPLALIFLCNEERTHLNVVSHRGSRSKFVEYIEQDPFPMDGDKVATARAVIEKQILHIEDISQDKLYQQREPQRVYAVEVEGQRTVLIVPLVSGGEANGAIVLYRREVRPFDENQIEIVKTFAAQAVIAIENVRQFQELETLNSELGDRVDEQVGEIERMGRLKRFLSPAVADTLVNSGDESMLASHRALIATLFCDIRGFTAFCERAEPEETIEVLQTYHEEMGNLISKHGGGVDKRMGDGIMVIFNDPLPCEDPAGDAVRLASAMRERMVDLCKKWKRHGHRLGFGVGISLGYATIGMVGSEGRYDYTASGTAVNLAARLCDQAEDGEILLSPRAFTAIEDDFQAESAGELELKGIREPVEVFRLLNAR